MTPHAPSSSVFKTFILYAFIWLIAFALGTYFRLYPLLHYTPTHTNDKASLLVVAQIKKQITEQIHLNHPTLSTAQKDVLVQRLLEETLRKESTKVRATIQKLQTSLKQDTSSPRKAPYLLASDSYYYYGLTQEIVEKGHYGQERKGSKFLYALMFAPFGHWEPVNLHPYVGFFLYKFLQLFNPEIDLMYAVSFTSIVVTGFILLVFLWLAYLLAWHPVVTLVSSVFFLLSPIFVKRSTFAWYDNDTYSLLFPLLILGLIFEGLKRVQTQSSRNLTIPILISGCVMLYAFFWHGWVLTFALIGGYATGIVVYQKFRLKENVTPLLKFFGWIFLGGFIAVSLAFGIQDFFILFKEGWVALSNFLTPQLSPWPDLYISVGELKKTPLPELIVLIGGYLYLGIALFGLTALVIQSIIAPDQWNSAKAIILSIFFATTVFLALGAQRFAIFALIPISLLFAEGLQMALQFLSFLAKKIKLPAIRIICLMILPLLLFFPIRTIHYGVPKLLNPIFNETWEDALTFLRNNTPPDSIINAWWSPGHFIKTIAQRRVSFDGATINTPQGYWISSVFLSRSEEEALGILRMLNNGGNTAAEYLQQQGLSLSTAVPLLKSITRVHAPQAELLLQKVFPMQSESIKTLLALTHKKPPPSYLFLYNEFVDNNLQLKFITGWDFAEIEAINKNPARMAEVPKRNSKEYIQYLWKMAGGAPKYSGVFTQVSQEHETAIFPNGVQINLKTKSCEIQSPEYGRGIPLSLFYLDGNHVAEMHFPKANLPYSVVLFKEKNAYKIILLDRDLAQSLLVRLYFFDGKGLKYIKPFVAREDLSQRTVIKVFEVDWEGFQKEFGFKDHQ
jgi:dolichyl-diphosphooligosaccharide--protein glycosyltransferase